MKKFELAAVLLLVGLAGVHHFMGSSPDVSWLLSICERLMGGAEVYVEIIETTPPVPILIYLPAAFLGEVLGVEAEKVLFLLLYLLVALTLAFSFGVILMSPFRRSREVHFLLLSFIAVLLIVPGDAFGQREYFAALFSIPIACAFIGHAETGAWPGRGPLYGLSLLAALALAIKFPVFAAPGIFLAAYYAVSQRSVGWLPGSGLIHSLVLGLSITGLSFLLFPAFFENIYVLMTEVYVPARSTPLKLLTLSEFQSILIMAVLSGLIGLRFRLPKAFWVFFWIAAGFLAGVFWQGKYFSYHLFPAVVMSTAAFSLALARMWVALADAPQNAKTAGTLVCLASTVAVSFLIFSGFNQDYRVLEEPAWAESLEAETMMAITPEIATAFPLARRLPGRWVGESHSQWVARYARFVLKDPEISGAERRTLMDHFDRNLDGLIEEIRRKKPSLLLIADDPGSAWLLEDLLSRDPDLLKPYGLLAEDDGLRVLRRL